MSEGVDPQALELARELLTSFRPLDPEESLEYAAAHYEAFARQEPLTKPHGWQPCHLNTLWLADLAETDRVARYAAQRCAAWFIDLGEPLPFPLRIFISRLLRDELPSLRKGRHRADHVLRDALLATASRALKAKGYSPMIADSAVAQAASAALGESITGAAVAKIRQRYPERKAAVSFP